jgi:hypothetical protein
MLIQEKLSIILLMNIFMTKINPYNKINKKYRKIKLTRSRIEKMLKYKTDKESSYEGLFLYCLTLFENYLEEIFL